MKPEITKLAILETVTEMDTTQAEKVLEYIHSVLLKNTEEDYQHFKQSALKEIQLALKNPDELGLHA